MAYSNINDENFNAITNFNISLGLSEKEKEALHLEYVRKNLLIKRYAGSGGDFPKQIPKYNADKVIDITNRYFTTDLEDIQLEAELQRDFINSKNKDLLERKLALEEKKKITEIKELNDAGIVLPEGVNYFSEEGRAYIRSEASKHPKGFNEYIKDKVKAKEDQRIIEMERKIAISIGKALNGILNLTNPTEINKAIEDIVNKEIDPLELNEQQKTLMKFKTIDLCRKEFNRRVRESGGVVARREIIERQTQTFIGDEERRLRGLNKLPLEFKKNPFPSFVEKGDITQFIRVDIITPSGFVNNVKLLGWINYGRQRNIIKILKRKNTINFLVVDMELNAYNELTKREVLEFIS